MSKQTKQHALLVLFLIVLLLTGWLFVTHLWAQNSSSPGTSSSINPSSLAADCIIGPNTVTAAGVQANFDNRVPGCAIWTLQEFTNGSVAPAITIQLERADDNGSGAPLTFANWPAPDIENTALGALTNIQNIDFNTGQLTYYRFYPWVRVNLVALSGGSVTYQVLGYRPRFGAPTTSAGGTLGNAVCNNLGVLKSIAVNITTPTTTPIVPVAGTASVYPCGGQLVIASSPTSSDTATLEYGTGASCAVVTKTLTGPLGAGVLTAAAGASALVVPLSPMATSAFGNGMCLVSTGTNVNITGQINLGQQ